MTSSCNLKLDTDDSPNLAFVSDFTSKLIVRGPKGSNKNFLGGIFHRENVVSLRKVDTPENIEETPDKGDEYGVLRVNLVNADVLDQVQADFRLVKYEEGKGSFFASTIVQIPDEKFSCLPPKGGRRTAGNLKASSRQQYFEMGRSIDTQCTNTALPYRSSVRRTPG